MLNDYRNARVALVFGVLVAFGAGAAAAQERAAVVGVDAVRVEPLTQTFPVIGRVVSRQRGVVAARVAGPLVEMLVEVGDRVAAGDVIARLDRRRLSLAVDLRETELREAEANRRTLEASLALAAQTLARLRGLRGSASFSKARFDDAEQEMARARAILTEAGARLDRAQVQLDLARYDLEQATVVAPYAGVVNRRHTEAGAYLSVGAPVVDLVDDRALELEADVPTDRLIGLVPGRAVEAELDDGTRHRAVVRAQLPEENPMTRTRALRFSATWGETRKPLAANQSATLMIPLGALREVTTVHKDAVINSPRGSIVYLVEDGAAALRPVRLGEAVGGRFEVADGLAPGDLTVIRGNERLRPGQPVRPQAGAPAVADAAATPTRETN